MHTSWSKIATLTHKTYFPINAVFEFHIQFRIMRSSQRNEFSAATDFYLIWQKQLVNKQKKKEAGEESEGRFKRGLMNNGHWSEQNSVAEAADYSSRA